MQNISSVNFSSLVLAQTRTAFLLGRIANRLLNGQAKRKPDPENLAKVLVLKTDAIGDFVLASAFLRELRLLLPEARITLIVDPVIYNLAERCPYIDEVIVYEQEVPRYLKPFILPLKAFKLGFNKLRPEHFDVALLPRWDMDTNYSVYAAYFSFAGQRIGYTEHTNSRKQMVNKGFDCMLTAMLVDKRPRHEVERHMDFIRYLGGTPSSDTIELWTDQEDDAFAERMLNNMSAEMLIAFCPGAGKVNRQWPPDRFIEVGHYLKRAYNASFIIIGGPQDRAASKHIRDGLDHGASDFAGRTTLRQTISLLKKCQLYVGNDTGSMHLAAAAGVPVIEISCFPENGPVWHWNSPLRFGPWRVPHKILQPASFPGEADETFTEKHLNRIHEISAARVCDAICELFPNSRKARA